MASEAAETIDEQIQEWRQGDFVLGDHGFVFRFNPKCRVTDAAKAVKEEGFPYIEEEVAGLVIVTQTCDIVREKEKRPFVETCPLVELNADAFSLVQKRCMPRFVEVPGASDKRLVADLDRVMTVEKPVLLEWKRIQGCQNDDERRRFADALSRKRARAALPNEFGAYVKPLRDYFKKVYRKPSDEAKCMDLFGEIRVQPSPDWGAPRVSVHFWFLLKPGSHTHGDELEKQVGNWMAMLPKSRSFAPSHNVVAYDDLSAAEYLGSDHLDFDDLSDGT